MPEQILCIVPLILCAMPSKSWLTLACLPLSCLVGFNFSLLSSRAIAAAPVTLAQTPGIDFSRHFRESGIEGSILIENLAGDQVFQHDPQRNTTAFPVASTFKILNSLIALETGVINDELTLLTWDGVEREFPTWNRDLNLKEAFLVSGVWFYQVLARRIGYERMKQWVEQADYGNQRVGDAADLDTFWLTGILQSTPQSQIQFLRRLYNQDLPFSERTMNIVKEIMIAEQTPDYTIRAKTGWFGFGQDEVPNIGWYIGYIETSSDVYFFATNITIRQAQDGAARLKITRRCLQDLGLL